MQVFHQSLQLKNTQNNDIIEKIKRNMEKRVVVKFQSCDTTFVLFIQPITMPATRLLQELSTDGGLHTDLQDTP